MELAGRMMDSTAEVPQSRRAKPSAQPTRNMDESAGLSFADTLIGLVQPPSPQEPAKAAPESTAAAGQATLAPDQTTPDAPARNDISATPPVFVPAVPVATSPINLASPPPADIAKQEIAGAAVPGPGAQSAEATLGLMGDPTSNEPWTATETGGFTTLAADASAAQITGLKAGPVAGETLALTTKTGESAAQPSADQTATAQTLAIKTQATASQSLMTGLAALGQTQQPVIDDRQMAQLVATATLPTSAPTSAPTTASMTTQATQLSPQPSDATTAQAGSAFDLALAIDPQGPSAARALEAQSGEARNLKANGQAGWLANGLAASNDAGLKSAPSAVPVVPPSPQATAAGTAGLLTTLSKTVAKTEDTKVTPADAAGMLAGSNAAADAAASATTAGTDAPATDTNPKPTLAQPHTLPILAAAMMRRIQNGMKEFTLRLDPPELGRVDVRLTVGTDKKVRAVVSTDRPEALKDLALSARDLTRALQEAGLELEENGLSFSMNDQGSPQQNGDANQQQSTRFKNNLDGYETSEAAKPEQSTPLSTHLSGPVERWQRARIAMTA